METEANRVIDRPPLGGRELTMARQQPPRRERRSNERSESPDRGIELPPEEAFAVLRNDRRRAVIEFLADGDGTRSVNELVRAVAAAEHGVPVAHLTERQYKCVYVSLLQVHLPKLAAVGLIEWKEHTGAIEGTRSLGTLAGAIDLIERTCVDAEGN